jgi:ABC-2 type transport system permease protein
MTKFFRSIIRASAFFRKEIFDILRQPILILTLVLGPFLILFLFGIGYHNQTRPLRTLFIAEQGSSFAQNIPLYTKMMEPELVYAGLSNNQVEALDKLRRGEVDLVIVAPQNAYNTILSNQQAVFTLYYSAIDPVKVSYIQYIGAVFVDAANRVALVLITANGQKDSASIHNDLQLAHQNTEALRQAIQSGDESAAQQNQQGLNNNINAIALGVGGSMGLLSSVQQTTGTDGSTTNPSQSTLTDLQQNIDQLNNNNPTSTDQRLANIDKIDKDLTELDSTLVQFQSINPNIFVSPFRSESKSIAAIQPSESSFFAPAVLALLLQHMAVTFAALSIVRERSSGAMELFRVSPLSAGEALFGKYVSYMLFGVVITAVLTGLLVFVLHTPMLGNWAYFAMVIVALLFTSLGIGFTISILSQTDSQAVQFSMIILLASVFFSGFFISLEYLLYPVKVISWLLPTTYGAILLRDITLNGDTPNWLLLGGLVGIGLVFMTISWLLMRRLTSSGQRMLK